jgi:hypothetical protein
LEVLFSVLTRGKATSKFWTARVTVGPAVPDNPSTAHTNPAEII